MSRMARRYVSWTLLIVGATFLLPQTALAARKVLRVRLDGPVLEAPDENAQLLGLLFSGSETRTLYDTVRTIEKAAADDEIAGIALIIEQPQMGFAQIEEVTRALQGFREAGKKVYCYMDYAGNGSYALACSADHITLAEYSVLGIVGLHAEASFYKGLLDKIGVYADLMHCGAYKSALEPFTRTEPSPEAAENINWLLDGIYERWIEMLAEGRGLSAWEVEALVDRAPLEADESLEHKLVDAVGSFPDFKKLIYKEFGQDVEVVKKLGDEGGFDLDLENPFAIFQMFSEMLDKRREPTKPGIALIYIDGGIIVGKNDSGPFGGGMAGSTTIRAAFEQAYEDESVKAIVVRVDSPGGSALGSDIMWKAATRCASEKPLIVSMGNVAGSGGYYVSIPGDMIFAEETTITASIGVVGGKFVWNELMENKLGITTTEFDRGKHAGLMSMNKCWSEGEREWMTTYLNSVYEQFKGRIVSSRGDRIKGNLEDMAGGRVYTGKQALELGLVDRIGGLSDAIEYATEKVGLDEYEVYVLPEARDFTDILALLMDEETEDEWEISLTPRASSDPLLRAALPMLKDLAPHRLRSIAQAFRNLTTLSHEHVGCFMPFDLTIR
ncbi:MAG: signal peptide peptidase SppA [Planctomycetes bacterium]|nr:signal peptide peptidase SppA [Planctomycetota bacterium]